MPLYSRCVQYTTEVVLEVEASDDEEADERALALALVEGRSAPHHVVEGPKVVARW